MSEFQMNVGDVEKKEKEGSKVGATFGDVKTTKEAIEFFNDTFHQLRINVKITLDDSDRLPNTELPKHFDEITIELQKMHKYLSDSVGFLRSYDIRVCQQAMKALQDELAEKQTKLLPKKKFAFRGAKKKESQVERMVFDEVDSVRMKSAPKFSCGFEDIVDKSLIKNSNEVEDKDVGLHRLVDCFVKLQGSASTVHATGLRRCKIFSGPVKTSIFIEDCRDCILVLACQQLRIHSSTDLDLYLHVTSNPIIEDCSKIRVAPYEAEVDFEMSERENKWDFVNDFNWLAADMPSPNWQIIPLQERLTEMTEAS